MNATSCDHGGCGCSVTACCLECPLAACRHDDYDGFKQWEKEQTRTLVTAVKNWQDADKVAEQLGVSSRTVYRMRNRTFLHKCLTCGHQWSSNIYPKKCAKVECQSPFWNKAKPMYLKEKRTCPCGHSWSQAWKPKRCPKCKQEWEQ